MRKIIQIVSDGRRLGDITALCDDGSVWFFIPAKPSPNEKHSYWKRLNDIPQDEANHEPNL